MRSAELKKISEIDGEYFFMTKSKKTEMLSFINHLRNAIAHGEVKTTGDYIEIKDYVFGGEKINKTPSAICRVSNEHLEYFFQELTKVI